MTFEIRNRILVGLLALLSMGLVACSSKVKPELKIGEVSIYADPDANQNSAIAVDLVMVYDQELAKTIGQMSAAKYFASSPQLLLDNPTLLNIWHWELVPGQVIADFEPPQNQGRAFGAFVFANYLSPGDHRVKVAPNGVVKILLMRDDIKNLEMYNTPDFKMGTTMSNIGKDDDVSSGVTANLGPTTPEPKDNTCEASQNAVKATNSNCQKSPTKSTTKTSSCTTSPKPVTGCVPPASRKPVPITTRPLKPPFQVAKKPYVN